MRTGRLLFPLAVAAALLSAGSAPGSFDPDACVVASADGRIAAVPSVRAHRLSGDGIVIDGRLDDAAWDEAEGAGGFRMWDPIRGSVASEETVFKVAYDDGAIYLGIACFESDPHSITRQLCRRDRIESSDVVSVYLDPYHDHTTGYNFRVSSAGIQEERYLCDDGKTTDRNWDAVWDAEVSTDDRGWYAEFRIPFSCIRYRPAEEMIWGFNVYRYMHARGEDTAWVVWDTETRGFISRFGTITGLRGVPTARQLEILPYVVGRSTDRAIEGVADTPEHYGNAGVDLKYGVTADLTLSAAFQPDFGQVEADPALLNLSPFETRYEEKRPFFIEGARFFQHPNFSLLYSRRIGIGHPNSRIRAAVKLTGKTPSGVSIAALYAATDITEDGRAHQFLEVGEYPNRYLVGRIGKQFGGGAHCVNLMQTAVYKTAARDTFDHSGFASRDAWTTGGDFDLNFHDRDYNVAGSFVVSVIDPEPLASDPDLRHDRLLGSGGTLALGKLGGTVQGGVSGRWESQGLRINDVGFLSAPDEMGTGGWVSYRHNSDRTDAAIVKGNVGLEFWRSWLHGPGEGFDRDTGELVWSYEEGHPQSISVELNCWGQFQSFWDSYWGVDFESEGVSKHETRDYEGLRGPLLAIPAQQFMWWGFGSDWRRPLVFGANTNCGRDELGNRNARGGVWARWNATSATSFNLSVNYGTRHSTREHLDNFENPGGGIGGVSYVFAKVDQQTIDATFRADILFTRNLSLQLYAQPYMTVGDYYNPRELVRPGSHEFASVTEIPGQFTSEGVHDYDFRYSDVSINAVLRWEYAPGSTFYLVWKQGRTIYDERGWAAEAARSLDQTLSMESMFDSEPENVLLAKLTYWFSL